MTTQARELAGIISNAGDLSFIDDVTLKSDSAVLNFGADSDVTLTHVADTALLLNSTRQLQFGDSGTYINQSSDGVLNLTSDTEVEINATTVDINANVDISGNLVLGGNITIGDADSDSLTLNADLTSHLIPNATNTYDIGTASKEWRNAYFDGTVTSDAFAGPLTGAVTGNADTATEATNVTAAANNSTDETVYPTFVDGATGTQGIETDTGLTYNPSTGVITATQFTGNVTGNVTGNASGTAATVTTAAQTNITSLGTLTTLTVDNVLINGTTIGHTSDTDLLTLADGALTVAGTIGSGVITCDGLITGNNEDVSIGGILKGSDSTFQILTSTSDGSDSSRVRINGGGSTGSSRGAQLELQGNEHTFVGEALLSAGDVNTAYVGISAPHSSGYITYSTAGSERFRIASSGQLGIAGANYGTDGQILTSTGASTAPAWEDAAEGGISTGKAIAMAMVFG